MFEKISKNDSNYRKLLDNLSNENISDEEKKVLKLLKLLYDEGALDNYPNTEVTDFLTCHIDKNKKIFQNIKVKKFWERYRSRIERYNVVANINFCPACGITFYPQFGYHKTLEHIFPKSFYHQLVIYPDNLVYYCEHCNKCKGDKFDYLNIYHPYFTILEKYDDEIILRIRKENNGKIDYQIKISRSAPKEVRDLFNNMFGIAGKYRDYILQFLNSEISTLEVIFGDSLRKIENKEEQLELMKSYLEQLYSVDVDRNPFCITTTERTIMQKLDEVIHSNIGLVAEYFINEMKV
ncbi:HNH endonuclease [Streptococcus tangpeifui]|uniref:HNH endonuclease n=1 Tax=Streptococcus tangpeifui TaxID=2709400 RepID=UPI0013EA8451|nr:HNH endonuclease [Streptococcus sp. ZJ1593]